MFFVEQPKPKPAQVISVEISCDVLNGANFSAENLQSINWTVSGYLNYQYLLKDNGIVQDFGRIVSNESCPVRQLITPTSGWHAYSIHVRNQTHIIAETYVVIEIIVTVSIWSQLGFWFTLVGGVAIVSVIANLVLWRRVKKAGVQQRNPNFFADDRIEVTRDISSNKLQALSSEVIPTQGRGEERWYTFISTTRVEKAWLYDTTIQQFIQNKLIRREVWEENRETRLDEALYRYLCNNISILPLIGIPQFTMIHGMRERERLLWIRIDDIHVLALLLSGRITHTYLTWVVQMSEEFDVIRKSMKKISPEIFFDTLDACLKISRSFSYLESAEATNHILRTSNIPGLFDEQEVCQDARGLTPSECAWVLRKAKELKDIAPSDSVFDEVEYL